MTRRERLEAKQAKREEWADKAAARSDQRFDAARAIADRIPLGQPILVDHHSARGHRRDLARIDANMGKAVAEQRLSEHHASKADGLARQLDRNIYSDDDDAIEALQARIADLEAEQARRKAINATIRKQGFAAAEALMTEADKASLLSVAQHQSYYDPLHKGFPPYAMTSTSANIRRLRERIATIKVQQERAERAEQNGGVVIEGRGEYIRVTFADKPDRAIINDLKAAGFRWGGGSWTGHRDDLPASVQG